MTQRPRKWIRWFFVGASIFFLLALGGALYFLTGSRNIVSSSNVDIAVSGPVSVNAGEPLELTIEVKNTNATTLEVADLIVEYPDGTRRADDVSRELPRHRESLGSIGFNDTVTKTVSAALFGEEESTQKIHITVEYRVSGSNAIFVKEREYEVLISSAPISVSVAGPSTISAGDSATFTIDIVSNSVSPLQGIVVHADYPFGFSFLSASPEPVSGSDTWTLGDIPAGGKKRITLTGRFDGQDGEERIVRIAVGLRSEANERELGTPFVTIPVSLALTRPSVDVHLLVGGDEGEEHTLSAGRTVRADVTWKNNLPARITDAVVEIKFSGNALNESLLSAGSGFYRSSDRTLIFDKRTLPALASVDAGASGSANFTLGILSASELVGLSGSPNITMTVSFSGRVLGDDPSVPSVRVSEQSRISVAANLALSSRILYFSGPLNNSGPLPPVVGQETTYTVVWSLTNAVNDAAQVVVRASLPASVEWVGGVSPSDASISYNTIGGEVTWQAGDVPAGTGFSGAPKEVAFQIRFVPSVSQVGTSPLLISDSVAAGIDRVTKTPLGSTFRALSTRLDNDPAFKTGQDRVVAE